MDKAKLDAIAEIVYGWDKGFLQHEEGDYACYADEEHPEYGVQICKKNGTPIMLMSVETYDKLRNYKPLEENMSGHQPWSEIKNKMGLVRRAKLWFGVKWDLLMMWISGE